MQSPQVNNVVGSSRATVFEHPKAVRGGYSDLQVLQSAAGFYIGTRYEEFDAKGELVWIEPGSRDTGYYATEDAAAADLAALVDDTKPVSLRLTP